MKNVIRLFGITALAAAIALVFALALAACGDGAGGGDETGGGSVVPDGVYTGVSGDTIYSLVITPKARAAATGDTYTLTIYTIGAPGAMMMSSGTVTDMMALRVK